MTTKEQPHGTFEHDGETCCNWCGQPIDLKRKLAAFDDLVAACEDLADFVEDQFRRSFIKESKAEINKMVKEHVLLAPVRAALSKAKGTT